MRCLSVVSDFKGDANCVFQQRECLLGMTEEEVDAAEVVEQATEVPAVGQLLVGSLCAFRVGPSEDPVPFAVGDDRRLEVDVGGGARVVEALGELERALDVFPRGLEITAPAVAARPPRKDVSAGDRRGSRSAPTP